MTQTSLAFEFPVYVYLTGIALLAFAIYHDQRHIHQVDKISNEIEYIQGFEMRKLKLQTQVSIDGFIAGENGEMDWLVWDWDEELKNYVSELHESVDLILLGRKLAEGFIDAWESRLEDPESAEFARKMIDSPKIVFSKTIKNIDRKNTSVAGGELAEEITKLKNSEGGDIIVYGGSDFVSSLTQNNLIDEYHLFVNPRAIGRGMAIFGKLSEKLKLKLVKARSFECGIVDLCYESK